MDQDLGFAKFRTNISQCQVYLCRVGHVLHLGPCVAKGGGERGQAFMAACQHGDGIATRRGTLGERRTGAGANAANQGSGKGLGMG